ncbi:hypothetical protein ACFQZX_08725 [Mucilaginibacter litoreus]|uniref:Glycerophosphoryl diester phosphodiesterase membrane domain-containing protein n=1 Tax=Mucilaginibacter litoreus TaxID=1048221 RepID=A0ABW3ATV8_9SPHI
MYHPFSVADTLKSAWDVLKKNFITIIVYSVISLFVVLIFAFLVYFFLSETAIALAGALLLLIIISYNFLAFIKLIFQLMDNQYHEISLKDIIPTFRMVGSYVLLLLLMSALTVFISNGIQDNLGEGITQSVLGIVAGYFFQFFFLFYFPLCTCYIVDDQSGPFESVAQSFHLIKGNIIKYLILFVVIEALIFIGSLTVVGIVLVIPFVNIILAVTYRKLVYSHQDVDDDIAETN